MAGRPKAKARKLAEIEERLYRVVQGYVTLMPDRPMSKTGIDHLWDSAFRTLSDAQLTTGLLLQELEKGARLDSDSLQKRDERDFEGCTETV